MAKTDPVVKANIIRNVRATLSKTLNKILTDSEVWTEFDDYNVSDKSMTFQQWCERGKLA